MARNSQRKSDRQPPSAEQMKLAVIDVVQNGCKLKTTAVKYNIKRTTLGRYVEKYKSAGNKVVVKYMPNYECRRILTTEQEQLVAEYMVTAANHNYGLPPASAKTLAMEFAVKNNLRIPVNWLRDSAAGEEWLMGSVLRCLQTTFH